MQTRESGKEASHDVQDGKRKREKKKRRKRGQSGYVASQKGTSIHGELSNVLGCRRRTTWLDREVRPGSVCRAGRLRDVSESVSRKSLLKTVRTRKVLEESVRENLIKIKKNGPGKNGMWRS